MFPSPCGVWVVSFRVVGVGVGGCFRPLAGCGLFPVGSKTDLERLRFPSPCGVWVVSSGCKLRHGLSGVSVPLRGVGCFRIICGTSAKKKVSVPLRGVGCFYAKHLILAIHNEFPSPCGVWVVSGGGSRMNWMSRFPSPCGVWVVSKISVINGLIQGFRPLAGCGLFLDGCYFTAAKGCFRPLAGCGLFQLSNKDIKELFEFPSPCGVWVVSGVRG